MPPTPETTLELTTLAATSGGHGGVIGWLVEVMDALGGPGAGLIIAVENFFPPVPSEVILPLTGFTASRGSMSLLSAIVWTTIGSYVGALALYWIGAKLGRERTRALLLRIPLLRVSDVDKTEAWFAKHGTKAVFIGRMLPLFRSFISVPAGVEKMRLSTFSIYTALGSLIWNVAFVVAGYQLGENWHLVERYAGLLTRTVAVIAILAIATFVVIRIRAARKARAAADAEPPTEELQRLDA